MWNFPLLPMTASTVARGDNWLMLFAVVVSLFFSALIAAFIFYFSVRYYHTVEVDRSNAPEVNIPLEIFWSAVPLTIMLVLFFWGARRYLSVHRAPRGAMIIDVVARQWMWKMQHPTGQREINVLHVPLGKPVELRLTSIDVVHSFFVPAFRIKQDVLPGRYTSIWFQATQVGEFRLFCAQYCGTMHSTMQGRVVVLTQAEYQHWLSANVAGPTLAEEGRRVFLRMGCATCHGGLDPGARTPMPPLDMPEAARYAAGHHAPPLNGLYGSLVRLKDGRTIAADDNYIRESILDPGAKIVAGFDNVMPSFQGLIDEQGVEELIAYIRGLSESPSSFSVTAKTP